MLEKSWEGVKRNDLIICYYGDFYLICPHFYLKVKVTSNDGVVVEHTKKILTTLCIPPCFPFSGSEPSMLIHPIQQPGFTIAPNPNRGIFSLDISNTNPGDLKINIYQATGNLIYSSNQKLTIASSSLKKIINLQQDSNTGIYYIEIQNDGLSIVQKMVINK